MYHGQTLVVEFCIRTCANDVPVILFVDRYITMISAILKHAHNEHAYNECLLLSDIYSSMRGSRITRILLDITKFVYT